MPTTQDRDLRERVDAFVNDLSELIRQAALDAVQSALGDDGAPVRRGPGRPRKATKKAAGRKPGRPRKSVAATAGKRIRRTAEDLEALASDILGYVRKLPGEGVEAISRGIGVASKELKRPIQALLAEGKLRTEGQRRGTTYYAGGGRTAKKATRKAKKKATRRTTKKFTRKTSKKAGRKKAKRKAA